VSGFSRVNNDPMAVVVNPQAAKAAHAKAHLKVRTPKSEVAAEEEHSSLLIPAVIMWVLELETLPEGPVIKTSRAQEEM
jgi:hypothetical protein